ncbi:hypothetical protein L1987_49719 [Smallanthus sonchifolius]|uniref:Uncharacterized protein n=1 Tax=Smallanthus sonchifolius TaxID=185202 RepID=A0ACB9FWD8_9ASTR|nr:hypothetical protein L1987_49719 [Smallanthus sonchifolius]
MIIYCIQDKNMLFPVAKNIIARLLQFPVAVVVPLMVNQPAEVVKEPPVRGVLILAAAAVVVAFAAADDSCRRSCQISVLVGP